MQLLYRGLLLLLLTAGCASRPWARTPMPVLHYAAQEGDKLRRPDSLLILLPGRKDRAEVFAREGFIAAVR